MSPSDGVFARSMLCEHLLAICGSEKSCAMLTTYGIRDKTEKRENKSFSRKLIKRTSTYRGDYNRLLREVSGAGADTKARIKNDVKETKVANVRVTRVINDRFDLHAQFALCAARETRIGRRRNSLRPPDESIFLDIFFCNFYFSLEEKYQRIKTKLTLYLMCPGLSFSRFDLAVSVSVCETIKTKNKVYGMRRDDLTRGHETV